MSTWHSATTEHYAPLVGAIVQGVMAAYSWYKFEQMADDESKTLRWARGIGYWLSTCPSGKVPGWLHRSLQFIEQPVTLMVFGVLGGILGLLFPKLGYILGACLIFALHRSRALHGLSRGAQIFWYVTFSLGLFWGVPRLNLIVQRKVAESNVAFAKLVASFGPDKAKSAATLTQSGAGTPPPAPPVNQAELELWLVNPGMLSVIGKNESASILVRDPTYLASFWNLDEAGASQGLPAFRRSDSGDFIKPGEFGFGPSAVFDLTGPSAPYTVGRIKQGDRLFGLGTANCSNCEKSKCYWIYYVYGVGGWYSPRESHTDQTCIAGYEAILSRIKANQATVFSAIPQASRRTIGPMPGSKELATVSIHCRETGPVLLADGTTYVLETFPEVPKGFYEFTSGQQQRWPDAKIGGLFIRRCDLSSYDASPLFDLTLSFNLTSIEAKRGKTETELIGGRTIASGDHIIEIPELSQAKTFTFYVHNSTEDFVRIREPEYATAGVRGSSSRISITLKRETSGEKEFLMLPGKPL